MRTLHLFGRRAAAALVLVVACSSSDPVNLTDVEVGGRWVLRDSSNINHALPSSPPIENPCIFRIPVTVSGPIVEPYVVLSTLPGSTLWIAIQDSTATGACGLDGPAGPLQPLPLLEWTAYLIQRGESLYVRGAAFPNDPYLQGRFQEPSRAAGRRDPSYDGRVGSWKLTRIGP